MCIKKEPYPTEILPLPSYKQELSIDLLLKKFGNLLVVRLVKGEPKDYIKESENGESVFDDSILGSGVNLSLNLAGGEFDTSCNAHLRFLAIADEAKAPWKGECVNPKIISIEDNYKFCTPCFGLCFYVREIHNRTFPAYRRFDTEAERDEYALKVAESTTDEEKKYDAHLVGVFKKKDIDVEIRPRIKVQHAPTNANYWHVTLDTTRPTDKKPVETTEKLSKPDKRLFKSLKQDLIQHCTVNTKPDYKIPRRFYMKWPYWFIPFL